MPSLTIQQTGRTVCCETQGRNLLQILLDEEILIDNPCGGYGTCGKCKVQLIRGSLPPAGETELGILSREELDAGVRLACMVEPEDDITIGLMQTERRHEVLTTGYVPQFEFAPSIRKQRYALPKPSLESQESCEDRLMQALGTDRIDWRLLRNVPSGEVVTAVFSDGELIAVEEGDTTGTAFGVAVDIGTTTVVAALVDLHTGQELANASMINAQKTFGLDVLTRITYEVENPGDGVIKLQKAIVDSLNDMIVEICAGSGVTREAVYEICVSANCTMMHMLLGIDATPIGSAPYAPRFVRAKNIRAAEIGLCAASGARLHCLPSVSAYIGADIVAGAYICDLQHAQDNVLFIDIGTNGEIVLASGGKLLCCSCAAGPALEGMNISSGMRAASGAIEDVQITEQGIQYKTIGAEDPAGICGSGILAAVSELIRTGLVRRDGAFVRKDALAEDDYRYPMLQLNGRKREFVLTDEPRLLITQGDVRQVQLAKGAILSGFYALLNRAGIGMKDLSKVLIAGQFGAHLPAESLVGAGLLPAEIGDRLTYIGNSSKTGSYMALMSGNVKREMEDLASRMDYIELGASDGYERLFAECLMFPEYEYSKKEPSL